MIFIFKKYLTDLEADERRKVEAVFEWIELEFPQLKQDEKWSTPMYTLNGTYIIGVKPAKQHFSVNPEPKGIEVFSKEIRAAGYTHAKMTYKIKYTDEVNYDLLREIIEYNIEDKKNHTKFWR